MQEKRITFEFPNNISASKMLAYAESKLKEDIAYGWKVGGILHNKSNMKTVILYRKCPLKETTYFPITGFLKSDNLLYNLQNSKTKGRINYINGRSQLVNDIEIKISASNESDIPKERLDNLIDHLQKAANAFLFVEFGFDADGCDCAGGYTCHRCRAKDLK